MDTSKAGVFDFLARTSNIGGSVVALGAIGGTTALDFPAVVALGLGAVGYAGGFLMFSQSKQTILLEHANDKVELESIERNIADLRHSIHEHASKLPTEILAVMDNIFEVLEEVVPRWDELKSFTEQKYTVNAIITDYMPKIITNYMNIPKSYYRNAAKKQVADEIVEQLTTLLEALEEIRDSLYKGVETDIKTQSAFLKERFVKNQKSSLAL